MTHKRGFTLTELLVVIVIIAILIGILIPTIKAIRQSAYTAETRSTIAQLSGAIQRYYQDHNAYPGIFSNRDIAASRYVNYDPNRVVDSVERPGGRVQSGSPGAPYNKPITLSENLALSLVGGLYRDGADIIFEMPRVLEGRGPASLNPNRPKQYTAYIPASDKILSAGLLSEMGIDRMNDSIVPEFVDAWPHDDKLPIIYARANAGAHGIISDGAAPEDQFQYDLRYLRPYLREDDPSIDEEVFDGLIGLGGFTSDDVVDDKPKANAIQYFRHPTIGGNTNPSGVPVEKDRYILIAAGPDRIFGTKDDIRSWGD